MNGFQLYTQLEDTVGSIDLHNSLHTFSIRILVWQLRPVKGILVLNTTQGKKKNVVHWPKRH